MPSFPVCIFFFRKENFLTLTNIGLLFSFSCFFFFFYLPLSCPLLQPIEILCFSSILLLMQTVFFLYGHIIFGEKGRGGGMQLISLPKSLSGLPLSILLVHVCVWERENMHVQCLKTWWFIRRVHILVTLLFFTLLPANSEKHISEILSYRCDVYSTYFRIKVVKHVQSEEELCQVAEVT